MAESTQPNPFVGRWQITHMDEWDQDFVNAEVEGYVEFGKAESGAFQFGYVRGQMDCRLSAREGLPCIEWTWEGNDEMDAVHGSGWASLRGDELSGKIVIHLGDESGFFGFVGEGE